MKKLLLLLCSIGTNAAFADTVPVSCSVPGKDKSDVVNVEIARLTGKLLSKTVSADNYSVRFLSFTGNYDEYLDMCIEKATSSQRVLGLKFGADDLTKYVPVPEKYHTLYDLLEDNPKLAAFAEVKAFGDLVKSGDLDPISQNEKLSVKLTEYNLGIDYNLDSNHIVDLSHYLLTNTHNRKLKYSKGVTFNAAISTNDAISLTPDQAEAAGLFLSRYLHANNGLLDNLPFSYGLTKNKTDNAVSEVEIKVAKKTEDSIFFMVRLYLHPTKFINPQNNPNHLMAVLSMPLVLHTKGYVSGDKKQKLIIEVPKTGPIVRFYNAKTRKIVDVKKNSELLALMVLGMTNLNIDPNAATNSDTFTSAGIKGLQ